jgi:hypothetical protein
MILPPAGVRVLIATRPVDFRRGADGLAATVQTMLRQDPFCGTVFVFRSKRGERATYYLLCFKVPGARGSYPVESAGKTWGDDRRFRVRLS